MKKLQKKPGVQKPEGDLRGNALSTVETEEKGDFLPKNQEPAIGEKEKPDDQHQGVETDVQEIYFLRLGGHRGFQDQNLHGPSRPDSR